MKNVKGKFLYSERSIQFSVLIKALYTDRPVQSNTILWEASNHILVKYAAINAKAARTHVHQKCTSRQATFKTSKCNYYPDICYVYV